jgi:hypothetical protein
MSTAREEGKRTEEKEEPGAGVVVKLAASYGRPAAWDARGSADG